MPFCCQKGSPDTVSAQTRHRCCKKIVEQFCKNHRKPISARCTLAYQALQVAPKSLREILYFQIHQLFTALNSKIFKKLHCFTDLSKGLHCFGLSCIRSSSSFLMALCLFMRRKLLSLFHTASKCYALLEDTKLTYLLK